jgi:hypothetical protein
MGRINTGGAKKRSGDNIAISSTVVGTTLKLTPPKGYYDGSTGLVTITDGDFIAENIRNGINLFGKVGNLSAQLYQTGIATSSASAVEFIRVDTGGAVSYPRIQVSGLTFTPKLIVLLDFKTDQTGSTTTYTQDFDSGVSTAKVTINGYKIQLSINCFVNSTAFSLPVNYFSSSFRWIAFG